MNTTRETNRGKTFLPDYLLPAHKLCLLNHDVLVELLRSGEEHRIFSQTLKFDGDDERRQFEVASDVFDWFERTARTDDRTAFLKRVVFPALLSDFLHFIYEALESARKAKLGVTYALIRKPLQENLFLLEVIAADPERFGRCMIDNPVELHSQRAGGLHMHSERVANILALLGEQDRFSAEYLAQLRYDKKADDGFDGICNKAIHLFTGHEAIRTEALNINFIFSDWNAKLSQWYYLYSRLPYLLFYARRLVEHICKEFAGTDPSYLVDVERRIAAATLLWAPAIEGTYRHPEIDRFVEATRLRLTEHCRTAGYGEPRFPDLILMRDAGVFPGEGKLRVRIRNAKYPLAAMQRRIRRLFST